MDWEYLVDCETLGSLRDLMNLTNFVLIACLWISCFLHPNLWALKKSGDYDYSYDYDCILKLSNAAQVVYTDTSPAVSGKQLRLYWLLFHCVVDLVVLHAGYSSSCLLVPRDHCDSACNVPFKSFHCSDGDSITWVIRQVPVWASDGSEGLPSCGCCGTNCPGSLISGILLWIIF